MMAITTKNQGAPKAKTRTEVTVNTAMAARIPATFSDATARCSLGHSS